MYDKLPQSPHYWLASTSSIWTHMMIYIDGNTENALTRVFSLPCHKKTFQFQGDDLSGVGGG